MPPVRRVRWQRLELFQDEVETQSKLRYDTGLAVDAGWQYDGKDIARLYKYKLPEGITEIGLLTDKLVSPFVALSAGADFNVENGYIVSELDFFAVPEFEQLRVPRGDDATARIELWGFGTSIDKDDMFTQFGYVVGLKKPSSLAYNRLVNAYYDCLTAGSTETSILEYIAACLDAPRTKHAGEVVQHVFCEWDRHVCITDREVYTCGPHNVFNVQVGDVLTKGAFLTDVAEFLPDLMLADLPVLALAPNWTSPCIISPLFLENRNVALNIDTSGELTRVHWNMPGDPATVKAFFDYIDATGVAETRRSLDCVPESEIVTVPGRRYHRGTLAHRLDSRNVLQSEPSASTLPSTINPYKFIAANVMFKNMRIVRLKVFPSQFTFLDALSRLAKLVPVGYGILFVLEFESQRTVLGESEMQESIGFLPAMAKFSDTLSATDVTASQLTFRIL